MSERILVVEGDARPADVLIGDGPMAWTHVAVVDAGRFLGLIPISEVATRPRDRIFADMLSQESRSLRIRPTASVESLLQLLEYQGCTEAVVLDAADRFHGAITRDELLSRALADRAADASVRRDCLLSALESSVIVAATDTAGTITEVNEAFCRITGYDRKELIGANHRLINSGHHPRQFWTSMWRTISHGGTWRAEVCNRAKDGSLYWVDTTIAPMRNEAGAVCGYIAVRIDITSRKLTEAKLLQSRERLKRVLNSMNDALIVDDLAGNVVYSNPRFRELFGIPADEPAPVTLEDYIAPGWQAQLRDRHERRIRGEAVPDRFEYEGLRRDGTTLWLETAVVPVVENGQIVGTQSVIRDISERHRAEAQTLLAARREALATLAGGIAHEFNSLLLAAATYLAALPENPEANREPVARAATLIQEAQSLSAALLELFSAGEQTEQPVLDLQGWLPACLSRLAQTISAQVKIHAGPLPAPVLVRADPLALDQVLRILLANAADAMNGIGNITVTVRPAPHPGSGIELAVADDGPGIPEAVRDRVFEPFFTTRNRARRSGLGLTIASRLVQQAGGTLRVEPNVPRGSVFTLRLRAAQGDAE